MSVTVGQIRSKVDEKDLIRVKGDTFEEAIPVNFLPLLQAKSLKQNYMDDEYQSSDFKTDEDNSSLKDEQLKGLRPIPAGSDDEKVDEMVRRANQPQIDAYLQVIAEKEKMIEKLEGDLVAEREKQLSLSVESQIKQEMENNYVQIKQLLSSADKNINQIVELALHNQQLENEQKNKKILQMFEEKDQLLKAQEQELMEREIKLQDLEKQNSDLLQQN